MSERLQHKHTRVWPVDATDRQNWKDQISEAACSFSFSRSAASHSECTNEMEGTSLK